MPAVFVNFIQLLVTVLWLLIIARVVISWVMRNRRVTDRGCRTGTTRSSSADTSSWARPHSSSERRAFRVAPSWPSGARAAQRFMDPNATGAM